MEVVSILITGALGILCLALLYVVYMSRNYRVFKKMGIPGPYPVPAAGSFLEEMKIGMFEFQKILYRKYSNEKVYGYFQADVPLLVVRDLDMIRDIMVKNFNSFVNRRIFTTEETFNSTMINLKGDHWRHVRNTVSPTFSSGKLRRMCPHVEQCAKALTSNLRGLCQSDQAIELKDVVSCYTMDVIASTGFGVNADSLNDKSSPFSREAKSIMNFSGLAVLLSFLFPPLLKILNKLGIGVLPKKSIAFFTSFVDAAMENRAETGNTSGNRHDFIQLVVDEESKQAQSNWGREEEALKVKDESKWKGLSRKDIQGQALIFILAGYDTVSTTMSFMLYTLAHHPDICSKVQEEVDSVLEGKFPTYESIQALTYMDMCINEVIRMYPPGFMLDRECTQECVVQGIKIPQGMLVMFPVLAIHYDPQYFPEPEKFNPDRFTPENKAGRHPFAHLPFGQGPRNCIGMRLAVMEMKIAMAAILQEMTLLPSPESTFPPKLSKLQFTAEDGLWVKLAFRKDEIDDGV